MTADEMRTGDVWTLRRKTKKSCDVKT